MFHYLVAAKLHTLAMLMHLSLVVLSFTCRGRVFLLTLTMEERKFLFDLEEEKWNENSSKRKYRSF